MKQAMSRSLSGCVLPAAGGGAVMIDWSPGTWQLLQSHKTHNANLIKQYFFFTRNR